MDQDNERTVVLTGPDSNKAGKVLNSQGDTHLADITSSIPKFKELVFEEFRAEYALSGDNVVIHFFLPKRKVTEHYWKDLFAQALNDVGQEHFQATKPRLVGKYTEELHSWWFKANGYGHIIDIDQYIIQFFEKLAVVMRPLLSSQSRQV